MTGRPRTFLGDVLREEAKRLARATTIVRHDAKADAYAKVAQERWTEPRYIPDRTQAFLDYLYADIPKHGEIIFRQNPWIGDQGDGKTDGCTSAILWLMEQYEKRCPENAGGRVVKHGEDLVAVHLSNNIPALIDAMTKDAIRHKDAPRLVQILFLDDALRYYLSWGGGTDRMLADMGDFLELRHKFRQANEGAMNGVVHVFFTTQMYKGILKPFREGTPVFKTALMSDKEEITKATGMSKTAWEFLEQLLYDIKARGKSDRKSEAVVMLPAREGRIVFPRKDDAWVNAYLRRIGKGSLLKASTTAKYLAIREHWKVPDVLLTAEQELERWDGVLESIAERFDDKYDDEDPNEREGKLTLLGFIEELAPWRLDTQPEERLNLRDFERAKETKNVNAIAQKVFNLRQRPSSTSTNVANLQDTEFVDWVVEWLIAEGFDPYDPAQKKTIASHLFKLNGVEAAGRTQWNRAKRFQAVIEAGVRRKLAKRPSQPQRDPTAKAVQAIVTRTRQAGTSVLTVDERAEADRLIAEFRAVGQETKARDLIVWKAVRFGLVFAGKTIDSPRLMAETEEGRAWQMDTFNGEVRERPTLSNANSRAQGEMNNVIGAAFEIDTKERLERGETIPGIFRDAPVAHVKRGGGNTHEVDLEVTYADGTVDYVTCKCYQSREDPNITMNTDGSDEVAPERAALIRDEAKGITTSRLVLLVRNLFYEEVQGAEVWNKSSQIPTTVQVKREHSRKLWAERKTEPPKTEKVEVKT